MRATTSKIQRPVFTDAWLHVAFMFKYLIFAAFGLVGALSSVPAIAAVAGALYEFLWAISIAVVNAATVGLIAYNIKHGYDRTSTRAIEWEWYATFLIIGLVLTYSVALITLSLGGSDTRDSLAIISMALLVFPVWRIRFLYRIIRGK